MREKLGVADVVAAQKDKIIKGQIELDPRS